MLGFEKNKFKVRVLSTLIEKKVQRLAIRFNDEDEKEFEARVSQARELQGYYESEMRFIECIDEVSTEKISELRKQVKTDIINKVLRTQKHNQSPQTESLKTLMQTVEEEYIRSMKK